MERQAPVPYTVIAYPIINPKMFEEECIQAHNKYREAHGTPALKLDAQLTLEAQTWAKKLAQTGKFKHSHKEGMGENIAYTSNESTGWEFTAMWYKEIEDYSWEKNGTANGKPVGHFTQVVWKESTKAGFGVAKGPKGFYAVGNYEPQGNMMMPGYYAKNVGRKIKEPDLPAVSNKPQSGSDRSPGNFGNEATSSSNNEREMPKPGTTVETKKEFYTEDGVRKKKTTTVTTTVTETSGGGYKTSTSTRTQVEGVPDGYDEVADKVAELSTQDSDSDDDEKNEMPGKAQDKFRDEMMQAINGYRKKHGAAKLTKSSSLEKTAQKHAKKMLSKDDLSLLPGRFGQSLSMMQPRPSGEKVAEQWFEEKGGYDFKAAKFVKGSGNFTQIVWKSSKEIGIGVASDKEGKTYIIALFDPPGNVQNQFADNVKKA